MFRFAVDHTEQRRNIFSVGVYTILAGAVLLVAILPLLGLFPQFDGFLWLIALYTMCSCFHSLCAQFVRAEGHTALFAVQGMINTVLVIGLNVLFLVGLRMGITATCSPSRWRIWRVRCFCSCASGSGASSCSARAGRPRGRCWPTASP